MREFPQRAPPGRSCAKGVPICTVDQYPIMKHIFFCLLATLGSLTAPAVAAPTGATEITASGNASLSLPPDVATVNAVVETNSANANDAIAQNNSIYDRVAAAVTKTGVARGDITLSYYNVSYNPRPTSGAPNPGERYGYTVSRSFSVKVREISSAGRVSDACIAAGATGINGVSFGLADPKTA